MIILKTFKGTLSACGGTVLKIFFKGVKREYVRELF
jgi:hypothetical protein